LLDTHVLLWWLAGSPKLSKSAHAAIEKAYLVYVSAATAWEIGIKVALGKLDFEASLPQQLARSHFQELNITIAHAQAAAKLPAHHHDPLDRMLVAQARLESLKLMTSDTQINAYDVETMSA
jgi:PIN domain nuclease of toxin-antitoxin system